MPNNAPKAMIRMMPALFKFEPGDRELREQPSRERADQRTQKETAPGRMPDIGFL
jgi:hypothetical protein